MLRFTSLAAAAPNTTDLFEVHRRHADRSIGTQHTKAQRERSKSINSHLLSSRSSSTPVPRTSRSVQRQSFPNKLKQTTTNDGRCVAIDVHGFANLHQHSNAANSTCSCLAAISNMAVQSFCRLVGHGNPAPRPWRKRFFLLAFLSSFWCYLWTAFPGSEAGALGVEKQRTGLKLVSGTALVEKG